jgi:hypothetical protein
VIYRIDQPGKLEDWIGDGALVFSPFYPELRERIEIEIFPDIAYKDRSRRIGIHSIFG